MALTYNKNTKTFGIKNMIKKDVEIMNNVFSSLLQQIQNMEKTDRENTFYKNKIREEFECKITLSKNHAQWIECLLYLLQKEK